VRGFVAAIFCSPPAAIERLAGLSNYARHAVCTADPEGDAPRPPPRQKARPVNRSGFRI